MRFSLTKPVRKYRNLLDFIVGHEGRDPRIPQWYASGLGPCPRCGGRGRVTAPDWVPCPVEGNKMADWVDCQNCKGTGSVPLSHWKPAYNEYRAEFSRELAAWENDLARYKDLESRISEEDARDIARLCSFDEMAK